MAIDFHLQSFASSSNTLLAGKMITVGALGIYAGTALSYNAIIMPALRKFSSSSSVAIWHETFTTAKNSQLSMIAASILGSAGLYYKTKNISYLYSAAIVATSIPYTLLTLLPINKKLFEIRHQNTVNGKSNSLKDSKSDDSVAEDLLRRWNRFHFGRTIMGFSAFFFALYGAISDRGVRFVLFK
ncbi:hypothetical protein EDD21DRAFT_418677 [Dissophora ornata]|nr:hypothetical protein BGZ58_006003 [Dissophora ornata]KAI8597478.1 hypothetical protein EDD21DRAFT_418677 [Dissophora ornata]